MPTRRGLITGLGALFLAAPAIVKAASLMPISSKLILPLEDVTFRWSTAFAYTVDFVDDHLVVKLIKPEDVFLSDGP